MTRAILERELEDRLGDRARTPQDAALRTLACTEADRADLLEPGWRSIILRGQRMDGSWLPESFAAAPNRGGSVTWYSSATLTTALCFAALSRGSSGARPSAPTRCLTDAVR
jgi:hypothetical protein